MIKCHLVFEGEDARPIKIEQWTYDTPLESRAIRWADHIDARHVVLHHTKGYHVYDLEEKTHHEVVLNADRPSLWSFLDGKIHRFGFTQHLLDKIDNSVCRKKLQVGDRVEF